MSDLFGLTIKSNSINYATR